MDERNIDKTKDSWKKDALFAIEDIYCMLVVFYVSKSSLISEACYSELAKTIDETTIALHYGPVKFIAIDVDDINNIGDFTKQLHQSILNDNELTKEEKTKRFLILQKFMKSFFDSNNERVRVHHKNEINRKMNYYEEIVSSFPELTHNMEKGEVCDETEIKEELKLIPKKIDCKYEEQDNNKKNLDNNGRNKAALNACNDSANTKLSKEKIWKAMDYANKKTGNPFVFKKNTEVDKNSIRRVLNSLDNYIGIDNVLGVIDTSLFGSHREGYIVTQTGLYGSSFNGQHIDFSKVNYVWRGDNKNYTYVSYKDRTTRKFYTYGQQWDIINTFLKALFVN